MDQVSPGLGGWAPISGRGRYSHPDQLYQMGMRGFFTGPEWQGVKLITPVSLMPKLRMREFCFHSPCVFTKRNSDTGIPPFVITKSWSHDQQRWALDHHCMWLLLTIIVAALKVIELHLKCKMDIKNRVWGCGLNSSGSVVNPCEHGNESSAFLNGLKFFG